MTVTSCRGSIRFISSARYRPAGPPPMQTIRTVDSSRSLKSKYISPKLLVVKPPRSCSNCRRRGNCAQAWEVLEPVELQTEERGCKPWLASPSRCAGSLLRSASAHCAVGYIGERRDTHLCGRHHIRVPHAKPRVVPACACRRHAASWQAPRCRRPVPALDQDQGLRCRRQSRLDAGSIEFTGLYKSVAGSVPRRHCGTMEGGPPSLTLRLRAR
jgi:hypothetical protein